MFTRHDFTDKQALARALAEAVGANLKSGIDECGTACLAVSGGSTPVRFFEALSTRDDIEWEKIIVTLVDERWVDIKSSRSNAGLVAAHLLQGAAATARFVPLFGGGEEPSQDRVDKVNSEIKKLPHPFDAVVLGMGNDGHTASFFPGGDTLAAALNEPGPAIALAAPGAGEARITLTLPFLLETRALYLHIEGAEKAKTLSDALGEGEVSQMPVRAVLRQREKPVNIYWAP
ncbi:6-phosphogluconolactonase, eukaryotic type [hydrothermal vent metagenome]|uniref:6-phosphogluconolactonase, eukaryotic type n=1 Tax=hydrothermal vent metagenome TaxID=652676 RepID=A0A3B0U5D9_9ZZZZ